MPYQLIKGDFLRIGTKKRSGKLQYIHTHRRNRIKWGKASQCINLYCSEESTRFEYALLKGRQHGEVRENYVELCHKCHVNYDRNTGYKIVFRSQDNAKLKKKGETKMDPNLPVDRQNIADIPLDDEDEDQ